MKKLLSIFLVAAMFLSIFSMSVGAVEMTDSEVVKFYHSVLKETAEKHDLIRVSEEYEYEFTTDLSELSGLDLKLTEDLFAVFDELDVLDDGVYYYNGVCGEYEDPAESEIYSVFNVADYLEWGYVIKEASYADNKIVIVIDGGEEYYESKTLTVELTNDNLIGKITEETYSEIQAESMIKKIPFMIIFETSNVQSFTYEEIPATSLVLSETNLTLGYNDTAEITYTVGPEDASFKDIMIFDAYNEDYETMAYAYEENGKIIIEAWGEGSGTIEVCTYSGDLVATCDVTVEYTFWDRIRSIFDDMFSWLGLFFGF